MVYSLGMASFIIILKRASLLSKDMELKALYQNTKKFYS